MLKLSRVNRWFSLGVLGLSLLSSGCAKQEFEKLVHESSQSIGGFQYIPAKVDILFVPDDSLSIANPYTILEQNLSGFIGTLQNQYWDYHVASSPISNSAAIQSVLVNPSFNSETLPDGTRIQNTGIVTTGAVTSPSSFKILNGARANDSGDSASDFTYKNLTAVLKAGNAKTNFLRSDAILAIIPISNGADYEIDPERRGQVNETLLKSYASTILTTKHPRGSSLTTAQKDALAKRMLRFYPIVASRFRSGSSSGESCLASGGRALVGTSYFAMNSLKLLSGLSISGTAAANALDFCSGSALQNALSLIASELEIVRNSYLVSKIALPIDFDPGSLRIYRENGSEIPSGGSNGWTYAGYQENISTIFSIINEQGEEEGIDPPLGKTSGYVIELHGSGRLRGSEKLKFSYECIKNCDAQ